MTDTYVLYHKNCADGAGAALAAYQAIGEEAAYIPVNYQEDPPEMNPGSLVYIVDFSYPPEVLEALSKRYTLVVIDHHKHMVEQMLGLGCLADKVLNTEKSGAVLTWEYFFPNSPVPELLTYIQDRDLWQWNYGRKTRAVHAYLQLVGLNENFKKWQGLLEDFNGALQSAIEEGEAILDYQDVIIDRQARQFYKASLPPVEGEPGGEIWVFNGKTLYSETCHAFLENNPEVPVCATWIVGANGKIHFSLRSQPDYDCSAIARRYGGGGHPQASGFGVSATPANFPTPTGGNHA